MVIPNIGAIMCANMVVQNSLRMQRNRKEEEERQRRIQPTFQSTLNKEKQKQRER